MRARTVIALGLMHLLAGWGIRDREPEWPQSGPMPDDPVKVRPLRYESITKGSRVEPPDHRSYRNRQHRVDDGALPSCRHRVGASPGRIDNGKEDEAVHNIELFDAYAIHVFATLHDDFPLPRRIDPAAVVKEGGIKPAKGEGETHLANVAQGTVNWLHATGFLFRDDPSDQRAEGTYRYVLSPRAFEALRLKLPDVLRKKGDKPEATVGSKVKELAMAAGKGFATEAGKQAASGVLSFVIDWVTGGSGGAAKN